MQEIAEKSKSSSTLILLDWEKAFDRVLHDQLIEALHRLMVPNKLISLLGSFYENAQRTPKQVISKTNPGKASNIHGPSSYQREECTVIFGKLMALPLSILESRGKKAKMRLFVLRASPAKPNQPGIF